MQLGSTEADLFKKWVVFYLRAMCDVGLGGLRVPRRASGVLRFCVAHLVEVRAVQLVKNCGKDIVDAQFVG